MTMIFRPSSYWWERADEARAQSAQLVNEDAKQIMRQVVGNYERIARITEASELRLAAKVRQDA